MLPFIIFLFLNFAPSTESTQKLHDFNQKLEFTFEQKKKHKNIFLVRNLINLLLILFIHIRCVCIVIKPSARTVTPPTARVQPTATAKASSKNANDNHGHVTNAQIEELSNQVTDLKLNLEGLEKERDFYFSKLRDIEIM